MCAELTVFSPRHTKVCSHKHTSHFGIILSAHGCGCKFWSGWNSASIFRIQPIFYMYKNKTYTLLVFDQKKIDAKAIFIVTDIMPNLALISETVKISAASIFWCINTSWCYCELFMRIILDWLCNFGGELSKKLFFNAEICLWTFIFMVKFYMGKQSSLIFFCL